MCGTPLPHSSTFECHSLSYYSNCNPFFLLLLFRCLVISNNLYCQIELKTALNWKERNSGNLITLSAITSQQLIKQKQHFFV